jgi:phosphoribosylanthranilate isomerase
MAKIKICGLFREEDIEYANEARPDYIGFVFTESRRIITPEKAARLRSRLDSGITAAGVFVNTPIENIATLYRDGIIDIAQLHGNENTDYIARLKEATAADKRGAVKIIKAVWNEALPENTARGAADYYLIDSGPGGTGKAFDWETIKSMQPRPLPWFLAGGIGLHNIKEALLLDPFGIDISSGAETDGVKDREKMIELTSIVRKGKGL